MIHLALQNKQNPGYFFLYSSDMLNNSHLVENRKPVIKRRNAVNEVLQVVSQPDIFTSTCNADLVTTDFSSSQHLNKVDNYIKHDRET